MSYVQIFVTLKITDNITQSALHAIQNRLNFKDLRNLVRSEFWELHFPGLSPEQAQQVAENLVTKTSVFANPNKHLWNIHTSDKSIQESSQVSIPQGASTSVLVYDRIDGQGESALESLQRMSGETPKSLFRGTWWDITYDGDLSKEEFQAQTERLAITTNRMDGIFANPHYQDCRCFYMQ